jgi:hypothetical protein
LQQIPDELAAVHLFQYAKQTNVDGFLAAGYAGFLKNQSTNSSDKPRRFRCSGRWALLNRLIYADWQGLNLSGTISADTETV